MFLQCYLPSKQLHVSPTSQRCAIKINYVTQRNTNDTWNKKGCIVFVQRFYIVIYPANYLRNPDVIATSQNHVAKM